MSDLSAFPQPPVGLHMSAAGQTIFTVGVSLPWVVLAVLAVRALIKDRSSLPLLLMIGGALCILMEPVVDVLGMCWFPRVNQWVGLEVFGRPIPMFMWPVYSWFVGGQAYLFYRAFVKGLTRRRLWQLWLVVMGVNLVLETPGIWMNVYTYYGKQPFNPWGLPLWWPPVNATMPIVAGFAIWKLLPHLKGWRAVGVIAILPMADGLTNGAIGLPVWTALNTRLGFWATYPAAVVSFGLAAFVIWTLGTAVTTERPSSPALETADQKALRPGGPCAYTPAEMLHIGDPVDQGSAPTTLWTTTNTAEALPGVLTPLAWTFWNEPCELGMRRAFHRLGAIPGRAVSFADHPDDRYSAAFSGRYAANVDQMRLMGDAMPGTSANALEQQLLGAVRPGVTNHPRRGRYPVVAISMPRAAIGLSKELAGLRAGVDRWWRASLDDLVAADAARCQTLLIEATQRFEQVMAPHSIATMLCQALYEQVSKQAVAAGRPGLERELITGYGDVEETAIVADMWGVAHDDLTLSVFLDRHGYHGPNEGQVSSHSWREDPGPVIAQLEGLRLLGPSASPAAVAARRKSSREAAEAELVAALPRHRRARARVVLRLARRFIPLREVGKASFLQCIDVGRAAAHRLGDILAGDGTLAAAGDVQLLTVAELTNPLPADVRTLVEQRRAQHDHHRAVRLPDTWTGTPVAATGDPAGDPDVDGDTLSGLPVSAGVYEGIVRVVTDPETVLEPGEVLVCETTDPSWASVMFVAGALVIDIGGPVSHGAIVARELGVPCVIGTRRAVGWLRTGDLVSVDGGAGTVRRVKAAN